VNEMLTLEYHHVHHRSIPGSLIHGLRIPFGDDRVVSHVVPDVVETRRGLKNVWSHVQRRYFQKQGRKEG